MWFKPPAKKEQNSDVNKLQQLLFLTEECLLNFDDTGKGETHKGKKPNVKLPYLGLPLGRI